MTVTEPEYVEEPLAEWVSMNHTERYRWVRKPTKGIHGIKIIDVDGLVMIRQVDFQGEEVNEILVPERDLDELEHTLIGVLDRHAE